MNFLSIDRLRAKVTRDWNARQFLDGLRRKLLVWLWQSGQGTLLNGLPRFLGNHLALIFPEGNTILPLVYFEMDHDLFALADPADGALCKNRIVANPMAQVWLADGWYAVTIEPVVDEERARVLALATPEMMLGKWTASVRDETRDEQIQLFRIQKTAACTGKKGQTQYAWTWAVGTVFFLFAWLLKRRK